MNKSFEPCDQQHAYTVPDGVASSREATSATDVVLSYDCLPKVGGAHMWLYEVYRRWPTAVQMLTMRPSSNIEEAERQRTFDSQPHGPLAIHRQAQPLGDLSILSLDCIRGYAQHVRSIGQLADGKNVRVHALRAFPEGFAGLLYRWLHPQTSRLITYAHGEEILVARMSRQLHWIAKRVYAGSDLVIANSENTKRLVLETSPNARVTCVHPGVDVASYGLSADSAREYRQRLGWSDATVIVTSLARMEERKNQTMVIRALAELRREGLQIAYVCAGDGPQRSSLMALAAQLGVEQWVRFVGSVSEQEKRLVFAACDIHAMPSIQVGAMVEGFGIVFLEAAAAGVPSISGSNGGQAEAVRDGVTGLVVDGTSFQEVCRALRALALDEALRRRMGEAGREWAAEHDWSTVARHARQAVECVPRPGDLREVTQR